MAFLCAAGGISQPTATPTRARFYRIVNEVPAVLMVLIVILAKVKPFS